MRTIKFRGKRIKDGKWIYGNLANYSSNFRSLNIKKLVIFENIASFATDNFGFVVDDCEVVHDTIGQFTGLTDKNGKEIYEGDIVKIDDTHPIASIVYETKNVSFDLQWFGEDEDDVCMSYLSCYTSCEIEVIGNIHDNEDLINESLCTD